MFLTTIAIAATCLGSHLALPLSLTLDSALPESAATDRTATGTAPTPSTFDSDLGAAPPVLEQKPPVVVYVSLDGVTLTGGNDNATANTTQIQECVGTWPPYGAGAMQETMLQALRKDWAAYNVELTTTRPQAGPYRMLVLGNKSCGAGGGVAPINCGGQNPNSIAFAYMHAGHMYHPVIQAGIASQELGHTFGLDHVADLKDIMSPGGYDADPSFLDKCSELQYPNCTAQHPAACPGGGQNAHRELLAIVGPSAGGSNPPPPNGGSNPPPPTSGMSSLAITSPMDGARFAVGASFDILIAASPEITRVQLKFDGSVVASDSTPPFAFPATNVQAGRHTIAAVAMSGAMMLESPVVTVQVGEGAGTTGTTSAGTAPPPPSGMSGTVPPAENDGGDGGGCACDLRAVQAASSALLLAPFAGVFRRRRRKNGA